MYSYIKLYKGANIAKYSRSARSAQPIQPTPSMTPVGLKVIQTCVI